MKIASAQVRFPSRHISTEETLELIKYHSKESFEGDITPTLRRISALLRYSGAQNRRWLAKGETPINLITDACRQAIRDAQLEKEDIDCIIYVGVGRGYIEPGSSYIIARALEMTGVACFDILDACMSQLRALNMAELYLKSGQYRNILIISGEFTNIEGGPLYPGNYALHHNDQLEWIFPGYTVGEAATAMIVTADTNDGASTSNPDWEWHFAYRSDLADLCTLPLPGFELFTSNPNKEGQGGVNSFSSYGHLMHAEGSKEIVKIFKQLSIVPSKIDHIFPHTSSKTAWEACAIECGVNNKMHYLFPDYGNLASASFSAGIAMALQSGQLKRGDSCVGWIGSAGMSFCAVSFTF